MPQPRITMNVTAWYKLAAKAYAHNITMDENENFFRLDGIPILIVSDPMNDKPPVEDPTGYSN